MYDWETDVMGEFEAGFGTEEIGLLEMAAIFGGVGLFRLSRLCGWKAAGWISVLIE